MTATTRACASRDLRKRSSVDVGHLRVVPSGRERDYGKYARLSEAMRDSERSRWTGTVRRRDVDGETQTRTVGEITVLRPRLGAETGSGAQPPPATGVTACARREHARLVTASTAASPIGRPDVTTSNRRGRG